ncbi:hypothetical protein [Citricoccus sp. NR2]|uniref:hypothetical protein n=1 Tax=Citricoccus sp. NR2 TaxID=3004095 RepID=UPI0022DE03D0|nr:hypothetical protein [Citricoccus sp. NR2]WBL17812.1 hypothetical protein O1A05_08300 [Citricoccus sp. NR2]
MSATVPAPARLLVLAGLSTLLLAGCAGEPEPEPSAEPAPTLHIAAAPAALDQAVGHALAEYLRDQGATVTVNTVAEPWRSQSGTDIAVVNSLALAAAEHTDSSGSTDDEFSVSTDVETYLEDSGQEVLAETPGTLRLNLVTSVATASFYGLESVSDLDPEQRGSAGQGVLDGLTDSGEPERSEVTANNICPELDWSVGAVAPALAGLVVENLEDLGCTVDAPSDGEAAPSSTTDPTAATVEHLLTTPDAAGLLYGADPRIADLGFATLQDSEQLLPEGRFLILGDADALNTATESIGEPVPNAVSTLASRLDGEQLTELTRIHQHADSAALDLDAATTARYWLFDQQLIDAPDGWF